MYNLNEIAPAVLKHPGAWPSLCERTDMPDHTPDSQNPKTCKDCRKEFPATPEFFYVLRKGDKSWLASYCKPCTRARTKAWQDSDPERMRAKNNRYYQENKEAHDAYGKEWSKKNPDKAKAIAERSKKKNADKIRKRQLELYYKRHDEILIERRKRRAEHPELYRKRGHDWYVTHKERVNAYTRNHRARRRLAPGQHSAADVRKQYEMQGGRCWWCQKNVGEKYHVDHLIPIARGGTNWPDNIVISCAHCNTSRGDKLPSEWKRSQEP